MKRVQQKDAGGCGIACVAMIAGMTYHQIKSFFEEHIFSRKDKKPHCRHYQLRKALEELGIQTEKQPFRHWRLIDTQAIVPINRQLDGGWHWIVFVRDGNRPYILDPGSGKNRRRHDFLGLNARGYYIAIL